MGGGRYTEEGATLDPLTCYEVTLGSELQLLQEPFLRMRKLQAQASESLQLRLLGLPALPRPPMAALVKRMVWICERVYQPYPRVLVILNHGSWMASPRNMSESAQLKSLYATGCHEE